MARMIRRRARSTVSSATTSRRGHRSGPTTGPLVDRRRAAPLAVRGADGPTGPIGAAACRTGQVKPPHQFGQCAGLRGHLRRRGRRFLRARRGRRRHIGNRVGRASRSPPAAPPAPSWRRRCRAPPARPGWPGSECVPAPRPPRRAHLARRRSRSPWPRRSRSASHGPPRKPAAPGRALLPPPRRSPRTGTSGARRLHRRIE
jgi:hypothetical protein